MWYVILLVPHGIGIQIFQYKLKKVRNNWLILIVQSNKDRWRHKSKTYIKQQLFQGAGFALASKFDNFLLILIIEDDILMKIRVSCQVFQSPFCKHTLLSMVAYGCFTVLINDKEFERYSFNNTILFRCIPGETISHIRWIQHTTTHYMLLMLIFQLIFRLQLRLAIFLCKSKIIWTIKFSGTY